MMPSRRANEELKKMEKDKVLTEDDYNKAHTEVQKITDAFIAKIDEVLSHKEKEIMEV